MLLGIERSNQPAGASSSTFAVASVPVVTAAGLTFSDVSSVGAVISADAIVSGWVVFAGCGSETPAAPVLDSVVEAGAGAGAEGVPSATTLVFSVESPRRTTQYSRRFRIRTLSI